MLNANICVGYVIGTTPSAETLEAMIEIHWC
jgi:hypothetical protein